MNQYLITTEKAVPRLPVVPAAVIKTPSPKAAKGRTGLVCLVAPDRRFRHGGQARHGGQRGVVEGAGSCGGASATADLKGKKSEPGVR